MPAPRLPINFGDVNTWGPILTDWLLVSHNDDGTERETGTGLIPQGGPLTEDLDANGFSIINVLNRRTASIVSSATPAINTDTTDYFSITALAVAITSMTTSLTGTPFDGQILDIAITDNGTSRNITWGTKFEASATVALPTATTINTRKDIRFIYNGATTKWRCILVA